MEQPPGKFNGIDKQKALPVPRPFDYSGDNTTLSMLSEANQQRRSERSFKWPRFDFGPKSRHGNLFICEHFLGQGDKKARTAVADFSVWPPIIHWLPEFSIDSAFSQSGKLVTNASEPGEFFYAIRLRSNPTNNAFELLSHPDSSLVGGYGYYSCTFWKEQAIAVLRVERDIKETHIRYPLFQQGNQLVEDKSFRPAQGFARPKSDFLVRVARTGDGSEVLIWGGYGYELSDESNSAKPDRNRFRETFSLMSPVTNIDWTSVPAGPDSFYYIDSGTLYEIRRGSTSVPHLPNKNIMHVRPGPNGALLLKVCYKKGADLAKLYWPVSKQIARIKPDLLPEVDPEELNSLFWLEDKRQLLAFSKEEVWFVPWEEIENLPRAKA
jgi:hypothetical protein